MTKKIQEYKWFIIKEDWNNTIIEWPCWCNWDINWEVSNYKIKKEIDEHIETCIEDKPL